MIIVIVLCWNQGEFIAPLVLVLYCFLNKGRKHANYFLGPATTFSFSILCRLVKVRFAVDVDFFIATLEPS